MLDLQVDTKFCFPKIFHLKFIFQICCCSCEIFKSPNKIKSSTYTTIIVNVGSDFLIKMHGHIRLFAYPSFNKYSLRQLYHMRPDCFNPYRDRCNLIEHILRGFVLFVSNNLNPLGIFIYMSLSMDPYR